MSAAAHAVPAAVQSELDTPAAVDAALVARYARDGFVRVPGLLSPPALTHMESVITPHVARRSRDARPLAERDTYAKAFLQVCNVWPDGEDLRRISFATRLASVAARLMGVRGVRMYHDQPLYKEPGGGFTPWHCDQQYWPLASERSVTAWIPLQATPMEMGPLEFAVGSHRCAFGRDLPIGDESERLLATSLADLPKHAQPYALGDVSFHAGWTFHRAGPNTTGRMRAVMTVIYIDIDMRVAEPRTRSQVADLATWLPGLKPGDLAASPLNPVLWEEPPG